MFSLQPNTPLEKGVVKVDQTRLNLIDGSVTIGFGEIHIQILIIVIEKYGGILMLVKFETNWMIRLREHSHTNTQHMSISRHS